MWAFSLKLTKRESICGLYLHLYCHHACCELMLHLEPLQQRPQVMEQQDRGTRVPDKKCTISTLAGQLVGSHTKGKFGFHDKQQEKCH